LDGLCLVLERYLPLSFEGTRITPHTAWQVLLDASCQRLAHAPSGNRLREVLLRALPAGATLEAELNALLQAQLPGVLFKGKRRYSLAADITLIPYHGEPQTDESEVLRAEAKSGTNQFHGYATLAIVHQAQRYVLAVHWVRLHETMDAILSALLVRVKCLRLRVRRLYLDKEFYSVAVLRLLRRWRLAFVLPVPLRSNNPRLTRIAQGRCTHWARYTVRGRRSVGRATIRVAAVKRNRRPGQRRVVRWFLFAVAGLPPRMQPQQVLQLYRQRFGIESSYRQLNQVRARTCSRHAAFRLLLVGLALELINLYVSLRRVLRSRPSSARRLQRTWLTLQRLRLLLRCALEALMGLKPLMRAGMSDFFS
jgi:putative transposase